MTNNIRNAFYVLPLLLAVIVGACTKGSNVPESIHKQLQNFKFSDARAFFDENAKLQTNSSILFGSLSTKSTDDDTLSLLSYFTVLWDNVMTVEMPDSYVYEIPLLCNIPLSVGIFSKSDSGFIHTSQDIELQNKLIIRKFYETGKIRMFISTAIGRNLLPDSLKTHIAPQFSFGNKMYFEGYEFYTVLNGDQIHYAYKFDDMHNEKVFLDILNNGQKIQKGGFAFVCTEVCTKSGEDGDYGRCPHCRQALDGYGYCISCGYYIEGVTIVGEVDNCPECGQIQTLCECAGRITCDICGSMICVCVENNLPCIYCGQMGCFGGCQENSGNPPEESGGGEVEEQSVELTLLADGSGVVTDLEYIKQEQRQI